MLSLWRARRDLLPLYPWLQILEGHLASLRLQRSSILCFWLCGGLA